MDFFHQRKKRSFSNSLGFSLLETIYVLVVISILTVILIPKLEISLKKSFKGLKNYSQNGFNSLKNSGNLLKEYRLLKVKISIKSYLLAAKNMYMSESNLPSKAFDLNRFTPVVGCYLSVNQSLKNSSKDCKPLSSKLNISSWESENRLFKIDMKLSGSKLNILAIPYIKENKGVNGIYDSESGIIKIDIIKGTELEKRFDNL